MTQFLRGKNLWVWGLLMALTLLSWLLGGGESKLTGSGHIEGSVILLLAFFKVRLVILHFMEISHAPPMLRLICEAWVVIACASIIGFYTGMLAV